MTGPTALQFLMGTVLEPMTDGAPVKIITASNRMFAKAIIRSLVDYRPPSVIQPWLLADAKTDAIPDATGEYFDDLHGTPTTEMYRPSLTEGSRKS